MTTFSAYFPAFILLIQDNDFDLDSVDGVFYLVTSNAEKTYRSCKKH